jgi:radical SAM additional 4Fe4S-binding domain
MKASIFNTVVYDNDGILIYNSMTNALAKIDQSTFDRYLHIVSKDIPEPDNESDPFISALKSDFVKGGYLVGDDVDEAGVFRVRNHMRRFADNNGIALSIAPTSDCNLDCIYCYENNKKPLYMNREVENEIIAYIDKHLPANSELQILWFGGEPLLALDTVCRLSDAFIKTADERGAKYTASIITNGYLLNRKTALTLLDKKVKMAQITIDGAPFDHNRQRPLKNGMGSFDAIFSNVTEIADLFTPGIRINVGRENIESFPVLLDMLEEYKLTSKVLLSVARLESFEFVCRNAKDMTLSPEEYAMAYTGLVKMIVDKGIQTEVIPRSHVISCSSVTQWGFLIGPDGMMYKCMEVLGNESECVGRLGEPVKVSDGSAKWLNWDILRQEKCRSCNILPLCLGGCPRKALVKDELTNSEDSCSPLKYNLPELVKLTYRQQRMSMQKNAG